jgi:hypothetical protein
MSLSPSLDGKYTGETWNGQAQPLQRIEEQYEAYLKDGYTGA